MIKVLHKGVKRISAMTLLIAALPLVGWGISVTPARTEVRLSPGTSIKHEFTVTNTHQESYNIEVSEKPWFVFPENKDVKVEDWLEIRGKKKFTLKPGESRKVQVLVRCPKNAVGEVMGMMSFTYRGEEPAMITPMVSVAVYVEIAGTEKRDGEIVSLGAGTRKGQFLAGVQIKSTGNIHLRPVGTIRLMDSQGRMVSEYTVPEMEPVFPGTIRDYTGRGSQIPPPAGRYILSAVLNSGPLELKKDQPIVVKENGDIEMEGAKP